MVPYSQNSPSPLHLLTITAACSSFGPGGPELTKHFFRKKNSKEIILNNASVPLVSAMGRPVVNLFFHLCFTLNKVTIFPLKSKCSLDLQLVFSSSLTI